MRFFHRAVSRSLLLGVIALVVSACATDQPAIDRTDAVYEASGRGESFGTAMNAAKMEAVRAFITDEIGEEAERYHAATLEDVIYRTRNPNQFVHTGTMETLRRENLGTFEDPDYVYELRIAVNVDAVRRTLSANRIDDSVDRATARPADDADRSPETTTETDWGSAGPSEREFIRRYIDSMTYMVYHDAERASTEPFLLELGVGQANSYLTSNGYYAVDARQVERLKEDQRLVYEEETGRDVSILQWVAQRLNADVYVELDATVSGSSERNTHYGQANITLRMFETSTGQLLGSVPYRSERAVSRVDEFDARANAVQSAVYAAMPRMIDQSRVLMEQNLSRGIRYEIVVQNTPDARMIGRFREMLRDRTESVETLSQSPDSTHLVVRHYGPLDEVEDIVYAAGDATPGMENIYQVIRRGKSLTFHSGL